MNKVLTVIVVILLLLGGVYWGARQIRNSQQMSQISNQEAMPADDQTAMMQDQTDDQTLNQISLDDTTDDSVLTDPSAIQ